jgi:hypothetical protein
MGTSYDDLLKSLAAQHQGEVERSELNSRCGRS